MLFLLCLVLLATVLQQPSYAQLTEAQKKEILKTFRIARATTRLPAANMLQIEWDDDLAAEMQAYTDSCDFYYEERAQEYERALQNSSEPRPKIANRKDDGYYFYLYRDQGKDPVGIAEFRTLRMAPYYNYDNGLCIDSDESREKCAWPNLYENVIRAENRYVGCGTTVCGPGAKGRIHACATYDQHEDRDYWKPYVVGERCSQCPPAFPICVDGALCAAKTPGPTSQSPTTAEPTFKPTSQAPTWRPTAAPMYAVPTFKPTESTSKSPTKRPRSPAPTKLSDRDRVTKTPTRNPNKAVPKETMQPYSSRAPTTKPSKQPTLPTMAPTRKPTKQPTLPTPRPTRKPSQPPTPATSRPIKKPTALPTRKPSARPSVPTARPSKRPTVKTALPTKQPTVKTARPSQKPSSPKPTKSPSTSHPSLSPIISPTASPVVFPTASPNVEPTKSPRTKTPTTAYPTLFPTTKNPTTGYPSAFPTVAAA